MQKHFYLLPYLGTVLRKRRYGTMLYLVFQWLLYLLLFEGYGSLRQLAQASVVFVLSLAFALSIVGEFFFRVQSGGKHLRRACKANPEIETRLLPIFERVYARVRAEHADIHPDITVYILREKRPEARATERGSICLRRGCWLAPMSR